MLFDLSPCYIERLAISLPSSPHRVATMFETTATPKSNLDFRCVFVAALEKYRKKTKTDLLTHPLSTQLQSCNTPRDILAVLHEKTSEFGQSKSRNEKLSSWLKPTIYVLYAFSTTLGDGFGLVRLKFPPRLPSSLIVFADILTCKSDLCWCWGLPHGEIFPGSFVEGADSFRRHVLGCQRCSSE